MGKSIRQRKLFRWLHVEMLETRHLMAFDPTGLEQEQMQLVNRFRTDPQREFDRIFLTASPLKAVDPNIENAVTFFNTNLSVVKSELAALNPVPPIAGGDAIDKFAHDYIPFMIAAKSQSHTLNGTLAERVARAGFDTSQGLAFGENLFQNAFSPIQAHAAFVVEWGNGPDGLQGRGHRNTLMNPSMKQGGFAFQPVTYDQSIGFGPNITAQDLIGLGVTRPMVTGAIFQDRNGSGWYEAGEGLSGSQITFTGQAGQFSTNAMTAGGYNISLPVGTYTAIASGGGMRFPITLGNVVMGTQNVWLNFIYDPTDVPPDSREVNNSITSATVLTGGSQTLNQGTIHRSDVDYFKFPAISTGPMRVDLQFSNVEGNLDLRILDGNGNLLAQSNTANDLESITLNITAGNFYYLVVEHATGGTGGFYTLQVSPPAAQSPIARQDSATASRNGGSVAIDVLSNDNDPDGNIAQAQVSLGSVVGGTASVLADRRISFTPATDFAGAALVTYVFTDTQGLTSTATVRVLVLDFLRNAPYLNPGIATDSNGDGSTTNIDALLIINEINTRNARALPTTFVPSQDLTSYVDVNGDKNVGPIDVLMVINQLNASPEAEFYSDPDLMDTVKKRRLILTLNWSNSDRA